MTAAIACTVVTYLPAGPEGVKTATIRNRTCRVSVAPPGKGRDLRKLCLKGGAVIVMWRDGELPRISTVGDLEEIETQLEHLRKDAGVAVVTVDGELHSRQVFAVAARRLANRGGNLEWLLNDAADEWCRCVGETIADDACTLLAVLGVPSFAPGRAPRSHAD
jgi:hypothetical protein